MGQVGVRQLRDRLSAYLKRVKAGELVVITERGKPVAVLCPVDAPELPLEIKALLDRGAAAWSGGKPQGAKRAPTVRGRPVAELVVEDRR